MVNSTFRPLYPCEMLSASAKVEVVWNPRGVRTFCREENSFVSTVFLNPDRPARVLATVATTQPRDSYTSTSTNAANVERVRNIFRSDRREFVHHIASDV
jgi:hypothetical protein